MGTIARGAKLGGGTNYNSGQVIDPTEVNLDINTVYTEMNGGLDDANIETATVPGAKSLRFTEIGAPGSPAANDMVLYGFDVAGATELFAKNSAGDVVSLTKRTGVAVSVTGQSIPHNTSTALAFDTENWDVTGWHSGSDAAVTLPLAGKYLVVYNVLFAADTDYLRILAALDIDGSPVAPYAIDLPVAVVSGNAPNIAFAGIFSLNAAQTLGVHVYQFNTSTGANLCTCQFAVQYLGN